MKKPIDEIRAEIMSYGFLDIGDDMYIKGKYIICIYDHENTNDINTIDISLEEAVTRTGTITNFLSTTSIDLRSNTHNVIFNILNDSEYKIHFRGMKINYLKSRIDERNNK